MVTIPKGMYSSLRRIITTWTKLIMSRVNGSNLTVGWKNVVANSPSKNFKLGGKLELPDEPPKEPERAEPHLS